MVLLVIKDEVKLMVMNFLMQTGTSCRSFAAVGVDPSVMGIGPSVAIPAAVKSAGLELDNIDIFEINEVIACFIVV